MTLVAVNLEDLHSVVQLACLVEDRSNAEKKALLTVARKVDKTWNVTTNRKTWESIYGAEVNGDRIGVAVRLLRPLSDLESLVESTRELGEDDKPVKLPDKGRWKLSPKLVVVE